MENLTKDQIATNLNTEMFTEMYEMIYCESSDFCQNLRLISDGIGTGQFGGLFTKIQVESILSKEGYSAEEIEHFFQDAWI